MSDKSALLSKTYGFNIVVALIVENFPQAQSWISVHPQTAFQLFAAANIVLRHFTSTKVSYALTKKADPSQPGTP